MIFFQIECLNKKQTLNINIYLKQVKPDSESLIQNLIEGNHEKIHIDNLTCLKKILPEKDEVGARTCNQKFLI